MEVSTIVNITLSALSFLLAAISVITIIITIKQNSKMLRTNEQQLEEMRKERQLSAQPILILENDAFYIDRPRLYYTPPEDSYEFLSAYRYEATLKNVSTATALCIDVSGALVIVKDNAEMELQTVSFRQNVLPAGSSSNIFNIRFTGDSKGYIYEALREQKSSKLPKIKIKAIYKNTCGGYFSCTKTMLIVPSDDEFKCIRDWHTCIVSAPTEAKEALDVMKTVQKGKEWERVFELSTKVFDAQLGNPCIEKISVSLREIPEKYGFSTLSEGEFEQEVLTHRYSRYVHKEPECISQK